MLKNLPEKVLTLWNYWEIRGMVLLSLLLQTILIIFGSRRKTNGRVWIRILVWSAYLSADTVATFALGNLARSQGDSSGDGSTKANNSIQAFWAPFLLLHLGGQDTITAYSIEDNELWLRHLLGLVLQVAVAFYVFSRSWGGGILPFIAIPMFIGGTIKYCERTWVLWSSCSKSLRKNSSVSGYWRSWRRMREPKSDQQREYLHQASSFFHLSMLTMQDLAPTYEDLMLRQPWFSKIPADGAFKVVEVELGLIYDMLYTKAPLIYSRFGIILRCICFLLSVTAFIIFQVKIEKHAYSSIDVAITYLLLAAAVFLELYAFLCLVFSDQTLIWLEDDQEYDPKLIWSGHKKRKAWASPIYKQLRKLTTSKRWSRSISQYNLMRVCTENKELKCFELVGIDEMMRQMHVNRIDLNDELQKFIFQHLQNKSAKMMENYNLFDKKLRSEIIGQRGDGVLERKDLLNNYKWCTTEVEFSRSILVWHLATELCYVVDNDASNASKSRSRSRSKCLSEYMMYLLLVRPNMLSKGFIDKRCLQIQSKYTFGGKSYEDIIQSYNRSVVSPDRQVFSIDFDEDAFNRNQWKRDKESTVNGVFLLAKQLLEPTLESTERWEMIEEVWMEMLTHAAAHCLWKEHANALRRGGELLTHVSFIMLHLGLSEQYEWRTLRFITQLTPEGTDYYNRASRKWRRSESSTPDEEEAEGSYSPVIEDIPDPSLIFRGVTNNSRSRSRAGTISSFFNCFKKPIIDKLTARPGGRARGNWSRSSQETGQETNSQQDQEAEQEAIGAEHGTTNVPDMETIDPLP